MLSICGTDNYDFYKCHYFIVLAQYIEVSLLLLLLCVAATVLRRFVILCTCGGLCGYYYNLYFIHRYMPLSRHYNNIYFMYISLLQAIRAGVEFYSYFIYRVFYEYGIYEFMLEVIHKVKYCER